MATLVQTTPQGPPTGISSYRSERIAMTGRAPPSMPQYSSQAPHSMRTAPAGAGFPSRQYSYDQTPQYQTPPTGNGVNLAAAAAMAAMATHSQPSNESILRSQSRYHRRAPQAPVQPFATRMGPVDREPTQRRQPTGEMRPGLPAYQNMPLQDGYPASEGFLQDTVQRSRSRYRNNPPNQYEDPSVPVTSHHHPAKVMSREDMRRLDARYRLQADHMQPHTRPHGNAPRGHADPLMPGVHPELMAFQQSYRTDSPRQPLKKAISQDSIFKSQHQVDPMAVNGLPLRAKTSAEAQAIYMQRQQMVIAHAQEEFANMHQAEAVSPVMHSVPSRAKSLAKAQAIYKEDYVQRQRAEARQLLEQETDRQRQLQRTTRAEQEMKRAEEEVAKAHQLAKERARWEEHIRQEEQAKAAATLDQREDDHAAESRRRLEERTAETQKRQQERDDEAMRRRNEELYAETQRRKEEMKAEAKRREEEQVAEELRLKEEKNKQTRLLQAPKESDVHGLQLVSDGEKHTQMPTLGNVETIQVPQEREMSRPSMALDAPQKERFGFFKKRRADDVPQLADGHGRSKPVQGNKASKGSNTSYERETSGPKIVHGGGGPIPGVDAPVSAVNAGERRVLVMCKKSSIRLPVTPTTTPKDLILAASTELAEQINPQASVLMESFVKVGIQRPLRSYEHIRDVLNSWDDDRQNSLTIAPSTAGGEDSRLDASNVPTEQPVEISCSMHYSQTPGKWDKRWVTIRSDGQVLYARKQGAKDSTNICHMSDFDIYTPNPDEVSTKIKPPKKICYAIKSQQKSSMFLTTSSFVHFFSTGDKKTAAMWYGAVQGWRSWYLVNIMGEGQKPPAVPNKDKGASKPRGKRPNSRDARYTLGTFQPLLNFDDFAFLGKHIISKSKDAKPSPTSNNAAPAPPSSFPRQLAQGSESTAPGPANSHTVSSSTAAAASADDPAFAPSGLLGRTYSQRQKAQRDREIAAKTASPWTQGPSLLNDLDMPRKSVDQGPGAQLGQAKSPSRDLWQNPSVNVKEDQSAKQHNPLRALAMQSNRRIRGAAADETEGPFKPDGLLAGVAAPGPSTTGKGVANGAYAKGPMLDMREPSQFKGGSLLARVERDSGGFFRKRE